MSISQVSLNLGIDFGTRYTKVCVRDTDRSNSWVVIPGRPENHIEGGLVVSQVGIHSNGVLVAGLTKPEWDLYLKKNPNLLVIDFIKMRLANLDPGREANNWYSSQLPVINGIDLSDVNSLENICAFFLSQVIKRSKVWIYRNDVDLLRGVEVDWSVMVGVPVEYCDSPALVRFQRVLCLAWQLSTRNLEHVTLPDLDQYLNKLRSTLDVETMPCFTLPELAAAIYSYTFSRQAQRGTYIFFDIGGGTMEGVALKFFRNNTGQPQIDFINGSVEPIGVNALAKRISQELPDVERRIEYSIIHNGPRIVSSIDSISLNYKKMKFQRRTGDYIANKYGIPVSLVKKTLRPENLNVYTIQILILAQALIHRQVSTVIRTCARKLLKQDMQDITVFLGGGGMVSEYYVDTIESTYDAFQLKSTAMPRYQMKTIPVPKDLSMSGLDGDHFHRFSIAYGLSFPDYDGPEFKLPTQVPKSPPIPVAPRWIPDCAEDDG